MLLKSACVLWIFICITEMESFSKEMMKRLLTRTFDTKLILQTSSRNFMQIHFSKKKIICKVCLVETLIKYYIFILPFEFKTEFSFNDVKSMLVVKMILAEQKKIQTVSLSPTSRSSLGCAAVYLEWGYFISLLIVHSQAKLNWVNRTLCTFRIHKQSRNALQQLNESHALRLKCSKEFARTTIWLQSSRKNSLTLFSRKWCAMTLSFWSIANAVKGNFFNLYFRVLTLPFLLYTILLYIHCAWWVLFVFNSTPIYVICYYNIVKHIANILTHYLEFVISWKCENTTKKALSYKVMFICI